VLAALEIQCLMNELMARNIAAGRPDWQLRVGINTGSIVAGVIGREKFAYDVWGDTVNTASRLEAIIQSSLARCGIPILLAPSVETLG